MATHLKIQSNGQDILDENGNPLVFTNDTEGQAAATAAAMALVKPVNAVQKYRVALLVFGGYNSGVVVDEALYNSNPIASVGIDDEAQTIHLNVTVNGQEVIHQPIHQLWGARNFLAAEMQAYTEYEPA